MIRCLIVKTRKACKRRNQYLLYSVLQHQRWILWSLFAVIVYPIKYVYIRLYFVLFCCGWIIRFCGCPHRIYHYPSGFLHMVSGSRPIGRRSNLEGCISNLPIRNNEEHNKAQAVSIIIGVYSYMPIFTLMIRHQMETFSVLPALYAGNSSVSGGFPSQRPVTRSFDFFLDCPWTNGWVNNGDVGALRLHRAYYDVTVMCSLKFHFYISLVLVILLTSRTLSLWVNHMHRYSKLGVFSMYCHCLKARD